jgi:hypothetical protein
MPRKLLRKIRLLLKYPQFFSGSVFDSASATGDVAPSKARSSTDGSAAPFSAAARANDDLVADHVSFSRAFRQRYAI